MTAKWANHHFLAEGKEYVIIDLDRQIIKCVTQNTQCVRDRWSPSQGLKCTVNRVRTETVMVMEDFNSQIH